MALKGEAVHLVEVCGKPGCPVCTLTRDEMDRYFDHMLYESVNDEELRARLRASWGFCNRHAHSFVKVIGGSVGIAVIYQDVLTNLLRALDGAQWQDGGWRRQGSGARSLVDKLKPRHPCVGCVHQRETERAYARALVKYLGDERAAPELAAAFAGSDGLCWRHLRMALACVRRPGTFETLVNVQQAAWERLRAELAEFIRKNDYRFRDEAMGPEGDSWMRAIRRVAGEPGFGGAEDRDG